MDAASRSAEIAAEAVETTPAEVCSFLRNCGPALVRINLLSRTMFLAVIGRRGESLRVLSQDLRILRIPISTIKTALCREIESSLAPEIMLLLDDAGVKGRRRDRALRAMLNERLGAIPIRAGWLLRAPCNANFSRQLKEARVVRRLAIFISATVLDYLLLVGAWWIIGRAALQGRIDYAWFAGWALILLTRIPLGLLSSWTQGLVTLHTACILKRRLLAGSLRLQPEEIRHEGIGHLLGRVIESEALESLALGGGLSAIVAVAQLVMSTVLLATGLKRPALATLLLVWTLLLCLYSWRYLKRRQKWTDERLEITNDLVESMAGHRTRLAQQPREQWHIAEDDALQRYAGISSRMDAAAPAISVIVPRGWLVISFLALVPGFVSGSADPMNLAATLGAILLASGALGSLTQTLSYISGAAIAWRQVKPLFQAATREEAAGAVELGAINQYSSQDEDSDGVLVEMRDVVFRHDGRADNVLQSCSMQIFDNDSILLEGPSGCGKSTLASVLSGLRNPESGLVTFHGLDRRAIGSRAWRGIIAAAPQFHENHIFSGTLAFNLLMGRCWPPKPEDYEEAEAVCRELGLGDLLDRMPAGLLQAVGEAGWQLSLGERCRVFLARALLQKSDLVILDESFGALDPESLQQAMACVRRRTKNLLVVAHP
jgi:ATP-binding cassette, subfamily B, bacterial